VQGHKMEGRAQEFRDTDRTERKLNHDSYLALDRQAVRLPKDVALPKGVKEVAVLRDGKRRVIVPANAVWNEFRRVAGLRSEDWSQAVRSGVTRGKPGSAVYTQMFESHHVAPSAANGLSAGAPFVGNSRNTLADFGVLLLNQRQ
jgi:virulence-associated protein VagC